MHEMMMMMMMMMISVENQAWNTTFDHSVKQKLKIGNTDGMTLYLIPA
jgi:hypothetical protein